MKKEFVDITLPAQLQKLETVLKDHNEGKGFFLGDKVGGENFSRTRVILFPRNIFYHSFLFTKRVVTDNCRNVRRLGKSMAVFRLFEKLRYSNERSTKFESLN